MALRFLWNNLLLVSTRKIKLRIFTLEEDSRLVKKYGYLQPIVESEIMQNKSLKESVQSEKSG